MGKKIFSIIVINQKMRRTLKALLFLAAVLVLFNLILHTEYIENYLITRVNKHLTREYNLSFSVGDIDYSILRLRFILDDVQIKPINSKASPLQLFKAKRIFINLPITTLFSSKIHLQQLRLYNPQIIINQSYDNREDSQRENSFYIKMDEFYITNGTLKYNNIPYYTKSIFMDIFAQIRYLDKEQKHCGVIKAREGEFSSAKFKLPLSSFSAKFKFDSKEIHFEKLSIRSDASAIEASGWLRNYLEVPQYNFQIKNTLQIKEFQPLFDTGNRYTGNVRMSSTIEGEGGQFNLDGKINGQDIIFCNQPIARLNAVYSGNEKELSIGSFNANIARGKMCGEFNILFTPKREYSVSLNWDSINLANFTEMFPQFSILISSETSGNLKARWHNLDINEIDAIGDFSFNSVDITSQSKVRKNTLDGEIKFKATQGQIEIPQGQLTLNQDTITFSGDIDRNKNLKAQVFLRSEDLSATEKFINEIKSEIKTPLFQEIPHLHLGGRALINGYITGSLAKPRAAFSFKAYEVKAKQLRAQNIQGTLSYDQEAFGFKAAVNRLLIQDENFSRVEVEGNFKDKLLDLGKLKIFKDNSTLVGSLNANFAKRDYFLNIIGEKLDLKDIDILNPKENGVSGFVHFQLEGSGTFEKPRLFLRLSTKKLQALKAELSDVKFFADLIGRNVKYSLNFSEGKTSIEGSLELKEPYIIKGIFATTNLHIEDIIKDFKDNNSQNFSSKFTTDASYTISLREWKDLKAILKTEMFQVKYQDLWVQNKQPILIKIDNGEIEVRKFHLIGSDTEFNISGKLPLSTDKVENISVDGKINLKLLQPFIIDSEVAGLVDIKSEIKGNVEQPRLHADIELTKGAFTHPKIPYKLNNMAFHALIDNNSVELEKFKLKLDNGDISAKGYFSLASMPFRLPRKLFATVDNRRNNIKVTFSNLDISNLGQLIPTEISEESGGFADGKIELKGNFKNINQIELEGQISRLHCFLSKLTIKNDKPIHFSLKDSTLLLKEASFSGEKSSIRIIGKLNLTRKQELDAFLWADIDSAVLIPFFNEVIPGGISSWELSLKGPITNPNVNGTVEIRDGLFQLRNFPIMANGVKGRIEISESDITLSYLQGIVNGGPFKLHGKLNYDKLNVDFADLKLSAKNIQLNYPHGFLSRSNAKLNVRTDGKGWFLTGDIKLLRAFYGIDVYPGSELLKAIRSRKSIIRRKGPQTLQDINLNIGVSTKGSIVIDNNMADLELQGNLQITGALINPIFSGRIVMVHSGEVVFGEQKYQIERAAVVFPGTEQLDPNLNVVAHTKLRHKYNEVEIKLTLSGPISNLKYSLSSFPPYSQDELASLLITGRSLDEVKSETANIIGNQMLLYFASPLASPISRTLSELLRIEEVRIEPINIATEEDPGARFTFGKRVSNNVDITYSIDVSNSQHQTWMLDYNLSRNLAIRSFRKDDGSYGSSFRHRLIIGTRKPKKEEHLKKRKGKLSLKEINIEGKLIFPLKIITKKISSLKKGSYFSYVDLNDALDNLISFYKDNNYLNAVITPKIQYEKRKYVSISIQITPNKPISIEYTGDNISRKLKSNIINSWDGRLPEDLVLLESKNLILNNLHSKGFYDAEVKIEKTALEAKDTFGFFIKKGSRYKIRNFEVRGNNSIASGKIKKVIKEIASDEDLGLWIVLYDFNPAKEAIETLYENLGFLEAVVNSPTVTINKEQRFINISLLINEGTQSFVHSVELKGNENFSCEELRQVLQLTEGKIYQSSLLAEDKDHLYNLYRTQGYKDVDISIEVVPETDSRNVNILYYISEGKQHTIAEIEIVGNNRTPDYMIFRELKLEKGDILNFAALSQDQKRLYDMGIFSSVAISAEPLKDIDNKDKVVIEVQEESNYSITYGIRYDSEDKLEGFGELGLFNIFGRGRNGLLYYRQNNREKDLRFSLDEPYLFNRKFNSLYSFFYNEMLRASFMTKEIGLSLQQQRELPYGFSLSYLYKLFWIHTYELESEGPFIFDITLFLSELSTYLIRDTRDNKMDAASGSFFSLNFSYSPEFLGSDLTYIILFGQYSFYKTLRPRIVWASNFRIGLADAFDQVLIPSERFYAGGGNSIRGFKLDSIGPIDPYLGDAEGGEALFVMNQELRFPIYKWIRGVTFYDMGNIYKNLSNFNPFDSRHSIGFGLRLDTPISLIRLDYGINLFPLLNEPRGVFFFSIGQAF